MTASCEIAETPEGFTIHIERPRSWLETILNAASCGVLAYFVFHSTLHLTTTRVHIFLGIIVGTLAGYLRGRARSITTTITKFEAHVVGAMSGGYMPQRYVPLADVAYLHYQDAKNGSGEEPDTPEGLYAALDSCSTCLVPYIGKIQAEELSDAIYKRFSHILGSSPSRNVGFSDTSLIQLNLNKP
jgi:hypothetical protein